MVVAAALERFRNSEYSPEEISFREHISNELDVLMTILH